MEGHLVELRAEFHDLQPFSGISSILLRCVARHARRTFFGGGGGPAFSALKSDHDPDALVFSHKGRCAAEAKLVTNNDFTSSTDTTQIFDDSRCFDVSNPF